MRFKKTPQSKRGTYELYDENGNLVTEYKPGENGVTEVDILNLHRLDDHEVYINSKELKLPEWYQPIYDQWRDNYILRLLFGDFTMVYLLSPGQSVESVEIHELKGGKRENEQNQATT